jgi:sec-independent protein translocase protein TatB
MFGIGLPEMIVIFAVALIVVGPDKLPGLARSLAKGIMDMKKTLNQVKDNLNQEGEVLDSVQQDLRKTAEELRGKMIDVDPAAWQLEPTDPTKADKEDGIIEMVPTEPPAALPRGEIRTTDTETIDAPPDAASGTASQHPGETPAASPPVDPQSEKIRA